MDIPHALWYAQAYTGDFWNEKLNGSGWSAHFERKARNVLRVQRILPQPKPTRDRLVDLYYSAAAREAAKKYQANKDCLLRPLLRRERQSSRSAPSIFSLRNYQLHIDEVKDIGLSAKEITTVMADALAVLHWHTKIDAMDIEFVFGNSPQEGQQARRELPLRILLTATAPKSTFGSPLPSEDRNDAQRIFKDPEDPDHMLANSLRVWATVVNLHEACYDDVFVDRGTIAHSNHFLHLIPPHWPTLYFDRFGNEYQRTIGSVESPTNEPDLEVYDAHYLYHSYDQACQATAKIR
ncbi:MAG: hypothetical protein Q9194_001157 [Teloschistes cf. exilis]